MNDKAYDAPKKGLAGLGSLDTANTATVSGRTFKVQIERGQLNINEMADLIGTLERFATEIVGINDVKPPQGEDLRQEPNNVISALENQNHQKRDLIDRLGVLCNRFQSGLE